MTVTITINGEDAGHALRELDGLASGLLARPPAPQQDVSTAAVAAASPTVQAEAPAEAPKATRTRKKADDKPAAANISANPDDRKPPEDDEATQAQDAADEQAEVEAAREPEKAITVDDLRGVMGEYVQKFEMPATQEDGPLIFADALGKPPAGEAAWKLSLLAELPQERLKAAYDGWRAAVDSGKRYQKRG